MKNSLPIALVSFALSTTFAQGDKTTPAEKMIKLIPDKIKGFVAGNGISKVITLGAIKYSVAEKNFSAGKKTIKILLFDYKEAPIMYRQSTHRWKERVPGVKDSLQLRFITIDNCNGWETTNKINGSVQLVFGIHDRFFLTVESQGVQEQELRLIVSEFKFNEYP